MVRRIYFSDDKELCVVYDEDDDGIEVNLLRLEMTDVENEPEEPAESPEPAEENRPAPTARQIASGRKCKNCGTPGHNAKTCFSKKQDSVQDDEQDGPEVDTLELIDKVAELKKQGMSSAEVAKKLGIPLADVNDLW